MEESEVSVELEVDSILAKRSTLSSTSFCTRSEWKDESAKSAPTPPLRLYIVRHGHSLSNHDPMLLQKLSDHTIPLSEKGKKQTKESSACLLSFIEKEGPMKDRKFTMWTSPYKRARETAEQFQETLGDKISSVHESIYLGEQQFGLFEGLPLDKLREQYPYEYSHFEKAVQYGGRFWARMPLGESRFDVSVRLRLFFQPLYEAYNNGDFTDAIIVTHGVTSRVVSMIALDRNPEWLEVEKNPKNCSIRFIEGNIDHGFIYDGFSDSRKRKNDTEKKCNQEPAPKKQKLLQNADTLSEIAPKTKEQLVLPIMLRISTMEQELAKLKQIVEGIMRE